MSEHNNKSMGSREDALLVKGLTKSFGGVKAINNVSLAIGEKKSRVLIGPNGAGKTTLFNLITGEIPLDSGKILLFGEKIEGAPVQKRSEMGLARTYQISNLFKEMTVEENLFLALKGEKWKETSGRKLVFLNHWSTFRRKVERIEEVAVGVGLQDRLKKTVSNLSHGEQRQLELGMVLGPNPRVILFDEPLAGLSPKERAFMGELVKKLASEKIALIIEHDMDFALSITENVTVLNHGEVIAEGSPQEIRNNPAVHRIYKLTSSN